MVVGVVLLKRGERAVEDVHAHGASDVNTVEVGICNDEAFNCLCCVSCLLEVSCLSNNLHAVLVKRLLHALFTKCCAGAALVQRDEADLLHACFAHCLNCCIACVQVGLNCGAAEVGRCVYNITYLGVEDVAPCNCPVNLVLFAKLCNLDEHSVVAGADGDHIAACRDKFLNAGNHMIGVGQVVSFCNCGAAVGEVAAQVNHVLKVGILCRVCGVFHGDAELELGKFCCGIFPLSALLAACTKCKHHNCRQQEGDDFLHIFFSFFFLFITLPVMRITKFT